MPHPQETSPVLLLPTDRTHSYVIMPSTGGHADQKSLNSVNESLTREQQRRRARERNIQKASPSVFLSLDSETMPGWGLIKPHAIRRISVSVHPADACGFPRVGAERFGNGSFQHQTRDTLHQVRTWGPFFEGWINRLT